MDCLIIGVAGGTGSGKSTFTNRIKDEFGDKVTVIYYDNYYRSHDDMPLEERKLINYDHPDAFETDLFIEHVRKLRNGESVECPVYDYTVHNRTKETVTIYPSEVIIVEGIMVLQNPDLRDLLDIKIFVEDIDEKEVHEAYDACRALIARCEHFSVGVNSGVYDFETTYKLGGTHLIYLYQKFLPIIENVRNDSKSDLPYSEFEKLYQNLFKRHFES